MSWHTAGTQQKGAGPELTLMAVSHSEADIRIAKNLYQRAIDHFKIPDEPPLEAVKGFLKEDGTIDFSKAPPLVVVRTWGDGSKFLQLAFFYDDTLTVLADYSPVITILDFLDEARVLINSRLPSWPDHKKEVAAQYEAFKMTLMLFSRIYPRMNLFMQNFVSEVIQAWFIQWRKFEAQVNSESGVKSAPFSETKLFRGLLKEYENDLVKLWLNDAGKDLDEKKMQIAREYPATLRHWQRLRKMCRSEDLEWRDYARSARFLDTPDDLLDKLENADGEKTFHFALEHAGRRAGLMKLSQDANVLKKRAENIKVTGYTPRQLLTFLKEGEKLLGEMVASIALHPKLESGEINDKS